MAPEPKPADVPARARTLRRRFCRRGFVGWLAASLVAAFLAGSMTMAKAPAARVAAAAVTAATQTGTSPVETAQAKTRSLDILDSIREDVDPPAPPPPPPPPPAPSPPAPAAAPAPVAPPPPVVLRDMLVSDDGTLRTGVGIYSDCSGKTPLTHASAAIDTCITDLTYFVGHNPGVFTPLLHMGPGSVITWYDNNTTAHRLLIIAKRTWQAKNGVPPPARSGEAAQFQTCVTADGSVDEILDAVAA